MVVINRNRKTALAIRRTNSAVLMIIMRSGKLTLSYVKAQQFQTEWRELTDSLDHAIATFSMHAEKNGATLAVQRALKKIAAAQAMASYRLF